MTVATLNLQDPSLNDWSSTLLRKLSYKINMLYKLQTMIILRCHQQLRLLYSAIIMKTGSANSVVTILERPLLR